MAGAAQLLRLERVVVSYGEVDVLAGIDLEVRDGEFVAIVGPSGCGKTTLLNVCSGWLTPTSGRVDRPAALRMVFQQDGLFPWLTVDENVRLGLGQVADPREQQRRADALLGLIGLTSFASSYPHQLSGGMRQRVELARALGGETPLLLMDEPFSSLDYLTRLKMRLELAWILRDAAAHGACWSRTTSRRPRSWPIACSCCPSGPRAFATRSCCRCHARATPRIRRS